MGYLHFRNPHMKMHCLTILTALFFVLWKVAMSPHSSALVTAAISVTTATGFRADCTADSSHLVRIYSRPNRIRIKHLLSIYPLLSLKLASIKPRICHQTHKPGYPNLLAHSSTSFFRVITSAFSGIAASKSFNFLPFSAWIFKAI